MNTEKYKNQIEKSTYITPIIGRYKGTIFNVDGVEDDIVYTYRHDHRNNKSTYRWFEWKAFEVVIVPEFLVDKNNIKTYWD